MKNRSLLPSPLGMQPHFFAFEVLLEQRFRRLDVYKLLIYFIDTVDAKVLPFLAEEFNVTGVKGWEFTTTEAEQRQLIKDAIMINRRRGTVWAIKRAMGRVALNNPQLQEHCGGHWAQFRINVAIADNPIDEEKAALLKRCIDDARPATRIYEGLWYNGLDHTGDAVTVTEDTAITAILDNSDTVGVTGMFYVNGSVLVNGSRNCVQDGTDVITINLI